VEAAGRLTAYQSYGAVIARAAAERSGKPVESLTQWDLALADVYTPSPVPISDAVHTILAAEQPMGSAYAREFGQLFDPAAGRFELCEAKTCDQTGFSVGFSGATSGLFYGGYNGTVASMRTIAHEGAHAVHRQLMNENQPVADYNEGPHFLFESFAIFNELLLLD